MDEKIAIHLVLNGLATNYPNLKETLDKKLNAGVLDWDTLMNHVYD